MAKAKGLTGMTYDQILMKQAEQRVSEPKYCRYCGLDVRVPSKNQPTTEWNQNIGWEEKYQAHVRCHQQKQMEERGMR